MYIIVLNYYYYFRSAMEMSSTNMEIKTEEQGEHPFFPCQIKVEPQDDELEYSTSEVTTKPIEFCDIGIKTELKNEMEEEDTVEVFHSSIDVVSITQYNMRASLRSRCSRKTLKVKLHENLRAFM